MFVSLAKSGKQVLYTPCWANLVKREATHCLHNFPTWKNQEWHSNIIGSPDSRGLGAY